MLDDSAVLLRDAGQKSGYVFKRNQRDIEAVAETHKPRALGGRIDIERARQKRRLVGHDPDRTPIHPGEAYDDVLRIVLLHFEEITVIGDRMDHILDVIGQVRLIRHDPVKRGIGAVSRIAARPARRIIQIVGRNESSTARAPWKDIPHRRAP